MAARDEAIGASPSDSVGREVIGHEHDMAWSVGGLLLGVVWVIVVPGVTVTIGNALWPQWRGPGLTLTVLITLFAPFLLLFSRRYAVLVRAILAGMFGTLLGVAMVAGAFWFLVLRG